MSSSGEMLAGGGMPQSVIETEAKQRAALTIVQRLSRMAGRELPIISAEDGTFPDEPGLYLFDQDVLGPGEMVDANFGMEQRRTSGAADSAHAVISGTLEVDFRNGQRKDLAIGAKCYQKRTLEDRLRRARNEVGLMRYMERNGELAIVPVGIAIAPPSMGSEVVLLTRWDDDLVTFDNNPWRRGPSIGTIDDALKGAAAVSRFDRMGLIHRDAKVKNVATNNRTGQVGMIDFETSQFFDIHNPIEAAAAASADFGLYMKSLITKGFFDVRMKGYTPNTDQLISAAQYICEQGYLKYWEDADPDVQVAVYDEVVNVTERLVRQKLGKYGALVAV